MEHSESDDPFLKETIQTQSFGTVTTMPPKPKVSHQTELCAKATMESMDVCPWTMQSTVQA